MSYPAIGGTDEKLMFL